MSRIALLVSCLILSTATVAGEETTWSVEVMIGGRSTLTGERASNMGRAVGSCWTESTKRVGSKVPLHYALRVARWRENRAWELQILHHKLYLRNRPPAVETLSVSHGFNSLTLNRALESDGAGPGVTFLMQPSRRWRTAKADCPEMSEQT